MRRAFRDAGQSDLALRFASRALELDALRTLSPPQTAALLQETFTLSLQLGRTRQAHRTLLVLHARGADERKEQYAAARRDEAAGAEAHRARAALYDERRADCMRTLVSQLAARRALQQLGGLAFDRELNEELHEALLLHARTSAVAPPWGAPAATARDVTAYEVAYALRVREGDYAGGATAMYELAARLAQAVATQTTPLPSAALRRVLTQQAGALAACLAALEQLPAPRRFLCDAARVMHGASEASTLEAAIAAHDAPPSSATAAAAVATAPSSSRWARG